jgi:hypothetical protein
VAFFWFLSYCCGCVLFWGKHVVAERNLGGHPAFLG